MWKNIFVLKYIFVSVDRASLYLLNYVFHQINSKLGSWPHILCLFQQGPLALIPQSLRHPKRLSIKTLTGSARPQVITWDPVLFHLSHNWHKETYLHMLNMCAQVFTNFKMSCNIFFINICWMETWEDIVRYWVKQTHGDREVGRSL